MTDTEDLYWRLHSLSKSLEGSGRIDEHDDPEAYGTILDAMKTVREAETAIAERDIARARLDSAVAILSRIYGLMYPAAVTTEDGRKIVFRPEAPHQFLQALADSIRAIPEGLARLGRRVL